MLVTNESMGYFLTKQIAVHDASNQKRRFTKEQCENAAMECAFLHSCFVDLHEHAVGIPKDKVAEAVQLYIDGDTHFCLEIQAALAQRDPNFSIVSLPWFQDAIRDHKTPGVAKSSSNQTNLEQDALLLDKQRFDVLMGGFTYDINLWMAWQAKCESHQTHAAQSKLEWQMERHKVALETAATVMSKTLAFFLSARLHWAISLQI